MGSCNCNTGINKIIIIIHHEQKRTNEPSSPSSESLKDKKSKKRYKQTASLARVDAADRSKRELLESILFDCNLSKQDIKQFTNGAKLQSAFNESHIPIWGFTGVLAEHHTRDISSRPDRSETLTDGPCLPRELEVSNTLNVSMA